MMEALNRFETPQTIFPIHMGTAAPPAVAPQGGFIGELKKAIMDVDKLHKASGKAQADLVMGNAESLHEVMIAIEKAGIATELTVAVRGAIIEGYREIMRMQV